MSRDEQGNERGRDTQRMELVGLPPETAVRRVAFQGVDRECPSILARILAIIA